MNKPVTLQELFNTGWKKFVIDNEPKSVNSYGSCRYRGQNNTACIIGIYLPDDLAYKYDKELILGDEIAENHPEIFDENTRPNIWRRAQRELHDDLGLGPRKEQYEYFAKKHNLTIPGEQI